MNFSVVIPTYNSALSLERALESLASISFQFNLEVVIVDDASKDESKELIQTFTDRLDLKYFRNEVNSGAAYSRNLGVEKATCNNIVFNDCDDISLSSRFESHGNHLLKHPNNLSFVSSIKRYGKREVVYDIGDREVFYQSHSEYARYILLGENNRTDGNLHFPCATMAIRKELFQNLGGFDNSLNRNEDVDFIIRALRSGASISTSSVIGVVRDAGNAPHQSGRSNLAGELGLLQRYGSEYLSNLEQKSATLWFKAKAEYFERNYITALKFLLFSGFFRPKRIWSSMIINFPRRILHDFRNLVKR